MTDYAWVIPTISGAIIAMMGYMGKVALKKINDLEKCYSNMNTEVMTRKKGIDSIDNLSIAVVRLTVKIEQLDDQIPKDLSKDLGILIEKTANIESKINELAKNNRSLEDKINLRVTRIEDRLMT